MRILIAIHILAWLLFSIAPYIMALNSLTKNIEFFISWFIGMLMNAGIFYLYYGYINRRFLSQQKIVRFILISALVIPTYSLIKYALYFFIVDHFLNTQSNSFIVFIIGSIFVNTFFTGMAIFLTFAENWLQTQQYYQNAEKEKIESELRMLRHQLNPHFLFNTLNNIHTLVYKKSDKAPNAILKLSNLMRYMLYESEGDVVPLDKELEYISNLFELQKLRLTNQTQVNMAIEGDPSGKTIAPLLLVVFIENAFKHCLISINESFIDIKITILDKVIQFDCCNSYKSGIESEVNSGIGLNNVEKRLKLQYTGKHDLTIDKSSNKFMVKLTLTL